METIILRTIDNNLISIDINIIKYSNTIKNMIDCINSDEQIVHLYNDNCTSEIIQIIKTFLEYIHSHQNELNELKHFNKTLGNSHLNQWLLDFINIENKMLINIINASDYLDIKDLLDFGCWAIANKIKNLSSEEVKKIF